MSRFRKERKAARVARTIIRSTLDFFKVKPGSWIQHAFRNGDDENMRVCIIGAFRHFAQKQGYSQEYGDLLGNDLVHIAQMIDANGARPGVNPIDQGYGNFRDIPSFNDASRTKLDTVQSFLEAAEVFVQQDEYNGRMVAQIPGYVEDPEALLEGLEADPNDDEQLKF